MEREVQLYRDEASYWVPIERSDCSVDTSGSNDSTLLDSKPGVRLVELAKRCARAETDNRRAREEILRLKGTSMCFSGFASDDLLTVS